MSQTVHFQELIEGNLSTENRNLLISHESDYDSDLTDTEEIIEANNSNFKKSNQNVVIPNYIDDSSGVSDDDRSRDDEEEKSHRSIPVENLRVVLKEPPGLLNIQLGDVIKNMTASRKVINPSTLFGLLCKK